MPASKDAAAVGAESWTLIAFGLVDDADAADIGWGGERTPCEFETAPIRRLHKRLTTSLSDADADKG